MTVHLAVALWILSAGQQGKTPKPGAEPARPPAQVILVGREEYKTEDGRALVLQIDTGGNVIEKFDVTDEMLEKWVRDHCKGHNKASIVIGVGLPKQTSIRAVSEAIEKVKKYVPKETRVTFIIQDQA